LIGKRRAALIVFLVMTVLSGLGMLLGAPVLGIAALAAAAVTFFWVRKYWSLLR
jgi:predicted membrane-bound spermidine synthase